MQTYQTIGLMSGTSMDGIDVALLETNGTDKVISKGSAFLPYAAEFQLILKAVEYIYSQCSIIKKNDIIKDDLLNYLVTRLLQPLIKAKELCDKCEHYFKQPISIQAVESHSTNLHAQAIEKFLQIYNISHNDIDLIGYHGQTVFHDPLKKVSVQLGDGKQLNSITGIPVVNNFRQNDIVHGGQGAPFAPLYHRTLAMRDNILPCVIVNCGGISNLTLIYGASDEEIMAYDAGPGNCLLDNFIRERTCGQQMMDANGKFALSGEVQPALIELLEQQSCIKNGENFYKAKAPKSLDVNNIKLPSAFAEINLVDGAATLAYFTAKCIVNSLELVTRPIPHFWILAGGGFHNPAITASLNNLLIAKLGTSLKIVNASELASWNADALEAEIFAYLAVRSIKNLPLSLPKTTGVIKAVTGGELYPTYFKM